MKYNYDPNFGIIEINNKEIVLTHSENIVFNLLYSKKRCTYVELTIKLYGIVNVDKSSANSLRVYINRINNKIKGIGKIINIKKKEYEFIENKGDKDEV